MVEILIVGQVVSLQVYSIMPVLLPTERACPIQAGVQYRIRFQLDDIPRGSQVLIHFVGAVPVHPSPGCVETKPLPEMESGPGDELVPYIFQRISGIDTRSFLLVLRNMAVAEVQGPEEEFLPEQDIPEVKPHVNLLAEGVYFRVID